MRDKTLAMGKREQQRGSAAPKRVTTALPKRVTVAFVQVGVRLFADDVAKLKAAAQVARIPWQVKLRLLVHDAVVGAEARVKLL